MSTTQQEKDAILYLVKILSLRDFAEDRMQGSKIFARRVKNYSNLLFKEIEREIDILYKDNNQDLSKLSDEYINASISADMFFEVGLRLSRIDEEQREKFLEDFNVLIDKYGIRE